MRNLPTNAVKEFYDKEAPKYDQEYDEPYWKLYNDITWCNVERFLPRRKDAVILDAGGGTGYWSIRLAKLGYKVVLADISENMLKVAEDKIKTAKLEDRIETKTVDIRDMSCFKSNSFDLALAEGDPVSYCLDAEKAISELARVVKRRANVIVSVDSKYPMISHFVAEHSFDELAKFLRSSILDSRDGAFRMQAFTPEELRILFESCGLAVVKIIGKPILVQSIPKEKRNEIIRANFKQILKSELDFCDVPSIIGLGGHLEIVGKKRNYFHA